MCALKHSHGSINGQQRKWCEPCHPALFQPISNRSDGGRGRQWEREFYTLAHLNVLGTRHCEEMDEKQPKRKRSEYKHLKVYLFSADQQSFCRTTYSPFNGEYSLYVMQNIQFVNNIFRKYVECYTLCVLCFIRKTKERLKGIVGKHTYLLF